MEVVKSCVVTEVSDVVVVVVEVVEYRSPNKLAMTARITSRIAPSISAAAILFPMDATGGGWTMSDRISCEGSVVCIFLRKNVILQALV